MSKKKKLNSPQCGNCGYSRKIEKPSRIEPGVECHRFPPTQETTIQRPDRYPFPIVKPGEWCGEYKSLQKPEKQDG